MEGNASSIEKILLFQSGKFLVGVVQKHKNPLKA